MCRPLLGERPSLQVDVDPVIGAPYLSPTHSIEYTVRAGCTCSTRPSPAERVERTRLLLDSTRNSIKGEQLAGPPVLLALLAAPQLAATPVLLALLASSRAEASRRRNCSTRRAPTSRHPCSTRSKGDLNLRGWLPSVAGRQPRGATLLRNARRGDMPRK